MKKTIAALAIVLFALVALAPAAGAAGADKSAKGTVSALGPDSVTIKADGKDMTFKVTAKTKVVARGAGTAAKEAKAHGEAGPKLVDVVHSGDEVQITYADEAGAMMAAEVRVTKKAAK
jgi:hypothetical protein